MPDAVLNKGTLFDMLLNSCQEYRERTVFIYRADNTEFEVSYAKLFDDALILAKAFKSRKVKQGSKVMLLSDNRYGWMVTDFALVSLGAISVPRGSDTPTRELEFILQHADCEFLVLETEQLLKAHEKMLKGLKNLKSIFIIEGGKTHRWFDQIYSYNDILKNRKIGATDTENFIAQRYALNLDDVFTLIYTSGTTGVPKGVPLTHRNIMYNVNTMPEMIDLKGDDRWVSILPSWHIFERAAEYIALSMGCCIVYSSVKTFARSRDSGSRCTAKLIKNSKKRIHVKPEYLSFWSGHRPVITICAGCFITSCRSIIKCFSCAVPGRKYRHLC